MSYQRTLDLIRAELRKFPGLYEPVPRYFRGISPQILLLNFKFIFTNF